ncbi:MAG: hypothetical protein ACI9UN_004297, partial [Granulosicoccus sp.]
FTLGSWDCKFMEFLQYFDGVWRRLRADIVSAAIGWHYWWVDFGCHARLVTNHCSGIVDSIHVST